jgi:hypothetical protein
MMGREDSNKIKFHMIINYTIFIKICNTLLKREKYCITAVSLAESRVECKFISMLDSSGTYNDYMLDKSDGQLCNFPAQTNKKDCTFSFTACRKMVGI